MGGAEQTWAVAGLPKWKPQRNCQDRPWARELDGALLSYLAHSVQPPGAQEARTEPSVDFMDRNSGPPAHPPCTRLGARHDWGIWSGGRGWPPRIPTMQAL